jgi:hypothetical protein
MQKSQEKFGKWVFWILSFFCIFTPSDASAADALRKQPSFGIIFQATGGIARHDMGER